MYVLTEDQLYDIIVMAQKQENLRKYSGMNQCDCRRRTLEKVKDMFESQKIQTPSKRSQHDRHN